MIEHAVKSYVRRSRPTRSGPFYGNLRRYLLAAGLPTAGVHIMRHSAALLRRDVGESVDDVSRFLDHSSLAVTTVYLAVAGGAGGPELADGGEGDRCLRLSFAAAAAV